jgi:hypothetical protein
MAERAAAPAAHRAAPAWVPAWVVPLATWPDRVVTWTGRWEVPAPLHGLVQAAGAVVLIAHVVAMWTTGFHSQDGPAHLFAADALGRLLAGEQGLLAAVYELNLQADPNWITYPVLAAGLQVAPPAVVELTVVSLLAVGTAAALWYAVTAAGRRCAPVAVGGMPLAVGWSLHTGLYNFTASVALMLGIVGYHLRVADRPGPRRSVLLAVLLVVLYFSHPLSLAGAYAIIGVTWLSATIAAARAQASAREVARRLALLVVAVAPSGVLMADFLTHPAAVPPRAVPRGLWRSLVDTVLLRWPIGAIGTEDAGWSAVVAAALWCAVMALVARRIVRRDWTRWDALGVLPLAIGAGAVLLPDRLAGGTLVQPRLGLIAALTLLLWIAVANARARPLPWLAVGVAVVSTIAMVALLQGRMRAYDLIDDAAGEVVAAAPSIPPGSLVLGAVSAGAPDLPSTVPLVHIVDRMLVAADAVPALTLDAGSGYGPIRYRTRFDPGPALRGLPRNRVHGRALPPEAFAAIARRYATFTGRGVDYLVLVGYDLQPADIGRFRAHGFRLVRHTMPTGLVSLFAVPRPVSAPVQPPAYSLTSPPAAARAWS